MTSKYVLNYYNTKWFSRIMKLNHLKMGSYELLYIWVLVSMLSFVKYMMQRIKNNFMFSYLINNCDIVSRARSWPININIRERRWLVYQGKTDMLHTYIRIVIYITYLQHIYTSYCSLITIHEYWINKSLRRILFSILQHSRRSIFKYFNGI